MPQIQPEWDRRRFGTLRGQTIALTPRRATTVGFLGTATHGPSSGVAMLHFADGTSTAVTLAFLHWTQGSAPHATGSVVALSPAYRDASGGAKDVVPTFVFCDDRVGHNASDLVSVTLPRRTDRGRIHVFAIATAP